MTMPAIESYLHCAGYAQAYYTLLDGRRVEVRNGCVVDAVSRHTLAGSDEAAEYLLKRARLTAEERHWIETEGRVLFPASASTDMTRGTRTRMNA
jgi:hypothetical protein